MHRRPVCNCNFPQRCQALSCAESLHKSRLHNGFSMGISCLLK